MIKFHPGQPEDADTLSRVAAAAKAYWGYPDEWLRLWADDLRVTRRQIERGYYLIAKDSETVAGFIAISIADDLAEIAHPWVLPQFMGQGIGRALFSRAVRRCWRKGIRCIKIVSDPNALGFYQTMGCEVIATQLAEPSTRALPVLQIRRRVG
jgi:GNAT superfamily N-acetyltransferase